MIWKWYEKWYEKLTIYLGTMSVVQALNWGLGEGHGHLTITYGVVVCKYSLQTEEGVVKLGGKTVKVVC